ncbi:S8 family serine peptidase [Caballeronia sp. DA-9]|uniref:S8 family serine peptidase n=1 Tax=Caballeronia sp. DA-9 TaxID=3436237 RepID=UPI003F6629D7
MISVDKGLTAGDAESFMRQIAKDPDVEYIEPDAIMQTAMVPNDPDYRAQWNFAPNKTMGEYQGINAEGAWDISNGAGVVIAELDNGVTKHSDLDANILPGIEFASGKVVGDGSNPGISPDVGCSVTWHGTHVAGILAAVTNNGTGVAGVAWGAKVLPVRVLNGCGAGYMSDIADGIVWASGGSVPNAPLNAFPAQVINMSLSGQSVAGECARTYQTAIDAAVERGTTIVVAAGNNGREAGWYQPAQCKHVIVVAGHQSDGQIVSSSNRGSLITVSAPGSALSTYNDGKSFPGAESYLEMTGTSMAAPHVAGVAALMQSASSTRLSPGEVRSILRRTSRATPAVFWPAAANLVDATAALKAVKSGLPPVANLDCVVGEMMFVRCMDKSSHRGGTIVSRSYNFDSANNETFWTPVSEWSDIVNFYEYPGTYYVTQKVTDSAGVTDQVVQMIKLVSPEVQKLTPNEPVIVSSNAAYNVYFSMEVPPGATDLKFKISGGSGTAHMYVRKDSPTQINPLCVPFRPGNDEECTFNAPVPGTYYVLLNKQPDFWDVTLVGSYTLKKG